MTSYGQKDFRISLDRLARASSLLRNNGRGVGTVSVMQYHDFNLSFCTTIAEGPQFQGRYYGITHCMLPSRDSRCLYCVSPIQLVERNHGKSPTDHLVSLGI